MSQVDAVIIIIIKGHSLRRACLQPSQVDAVSVIIFCIAILLTHPQTPLCALNNNNKKWPLPPFCAPTYILLLVKGTGVAPGCCGKKPRAHVVHTAIGHGTPVDTCSFYRGAGAGGNVIIVCWAGCCLLRVLSWPTLKNLPYISVFFSFWGT